MEYIFNKIDNHHLQYKYNSYSSLWRTTVLVLNTIDMAHKTLSKKPSSCFIIEPTTNVLRLVQKVAADFNGIFYWLAG